MRRIKRMRSRICRMQLNAVGQPEFRPMLGDDAHAQGPPNPPVPTNVNKVGTGGSKRKPKKISEDDLEEVDAGAGEAAAGFRINAKTVFLTFADCDWKKEDVLAYLEAKHGKLLKYAIGEEFHQAGNAHIHAICHWPNKIDSENVRVFDLERAGRTWHPKIVHAGSRFAKWWMDKYYYCTKDGRYIDGGIDLYTSPANFINRQENELAWRDYRLYRSSVHPWPVRFINGELYTHVPRIKRRHFMFIGPPNRGKTEWYNETLTEMGRKNLKLFCPSEGDNFMDDYKGEELCIIDDFVPPESLLIALCQTWYVTKMCKRRYRNRAYPRGTPRVVVWFINTERVPLWVRESWFQARFKVYENAGWVWNRCDIWSPIEERYTLDQSDQFLVEYNDSKLAQVVSSGNVPGIAGNVSEVGSCSTDLVPDNDGERTGNGNPARPGMGAAWG